MSSNAIARRLESIQTKGAMHSADVANILNVRPETVSRWNKGKALPHPNTEKQLLELEFILDKLADLYEPHDARLWLFARQRLLQDRVPAELIQQGRVDEVLAVVNQLLDGVHL
jgi:transcriptional regulator with XRE-family HTH domain